MLGRQIDAQRVIDAQRPKLDTYFDRYRQHIYGATRSNNLKHWEDITETVSTPDDARHGTVFGAPRSAIAPPGR
jgi:hypothetical protein